MKYLALMIAIVLAPMSANAMGLKPFPPEGYIMAPGDCRGGLGSLFQETSDNLYRCPATSTEKFIGGSVSAVLLFVAAAEMAGADIAGSGGPISELGKALGLTF